MVDLLSGLKSLAGGTTAVSCVVLSFVLELFPVSGTETFVELVVDLLSGDADAVGAVILLLHEVSMTAAVIALISAIFEFVFILTLLV